MVEYSKLQNGSDIRGVALPLVAAEPVNLTEEAAGQIGRAFAVWLAERGLLPEVRTVIVPGLLPNEDTVDRVSRLLAPYQEAAPIRYKIIAYRPMGVRSEYSHYPTPTKAELAALKAAAEQNGMKTVVTV